MKSPRSSALCIFALPHGFTMSHFLMDLPCGFIRTLAMRHPVIWAVRTASEKMLFSPRINMLESLTWLNRMKLTGLTLNLQGLMLCWRQEGMQANWEWSAARAFTGSHRTNLTAWCYTLNYHTPGDCYYKLCEGHKESLPPLGALLLILLYMFLLLWLQPWCALSGGGAFKICRRKEKKETKKPVKWLLLVCLLACLWRTRTLSIFCQMPVLPSKPYFLGVGGGRD